MYMHFMNNLPGLGVEYVVPVMELGRVGVRVPVHIIACFQGTHSVCECTDEESE